MPEVTVGIPLMFIVASEDALAVKVPKFAPFFWIVNLALFTVGIVGAVAFTEITPPVAVTVTIPVPIIFVELKAVCPSCKLILTLPFVILFTLVFPLSEFVTTKLPKVSQP